MSGQAVGIPNDQLPAGAAFVTAEAVLEAETGPPYRYRRLARAFLQGWRSPRRRRTRDDTVDRKRTGAQMDAIMVTRFQQGERWVFDLLIAKYQHRLLRVITRLIPNPADAEEVLQETLLRAFRALPQFRQESAFYTWLFRIGVNAAKLFLKLQKRRSGISVPLGLGTDAQDTVIPEAVDPNSPQSELENKQLVSVLTKALAALPVDLASPLLLREMEEMSYREIADSLQCPIGTVRSRLFRAREIINDRIRPLIEPGIVQKKGGVADD